MKVSSLVRSSTERRRRNFRRVLAGSIATALAAHVVSAVTLKWDANGASPGALDGSGIWNTQNQNWQSGLSNIQWNNNLDYDAQFGNGGAQYSEILVRVPINVGNMTFTSLGPNYTISADPGQGGSLTFTRTDSTITTNSDAVLKIKLAAGNAIAKEGAGRLVIRGEAPMLNAPADTPTTANSYAGTLKVNNGLLQFGGNYFDEGGIVGDFSVGASGTLRLNQSNIISRTAKGALEGYLELAGYSATFGALSGTGVVTTASGAPTIKLGNGVQTFSGSIRGPISLVIAGADGNSIGGAQQTLTGVNSYTGTTTIQNATVVDGLAGSLTLGNTLAAYRSVISVQVANGLKFGGGIGNFIIGGLAGSGNVALVDANGIGISLRAGTNDLNSIPVYTGTLSGNGTFSSFTKTGISNLTFAPSTPHTYLGTTGVDRGKLTLDFSNMSTPTNMLSSTSTLRLGGGVLEIKAGSAAASQAFGGFVIAPGGGTIMTTSGGSSALLTLPDAWVRNTGGTVNFDLRDANTGVLSSPTLTNDVVPWANVLDNAGVGFATSGGGVIQRYSGATLAFGEANLTSATTNYDLEFAANPTQNLNGNRTANTIRSVTSSGAAATLDLGTNTLTTNAVMNASSIPLVVQASGGSLAIGATNSLAIHLAGNDGGGVLTGGNTLITAPIVNNGANASSVTVQAAVGTVATLTLSGQSTFTGGLFLNGGTTIVDASSISSGGAVVSGPLGAGKVTFAGGNIEGSTGFSATPLVIGNNIDFLRDTTIPLVGGGTKSLNFAGTVTLIDGPRTFNNFNSQDTIFSGAIVDGTNAAGLTISGSPVSRTIFQGANTYAGVTTVDKGILQVGNGLFSGTLGTGPVYVGTQGVLAFNRADDFSLINEVAGPGTLEHDRASTLTLVNPHDTIGKLVIGAEGAIIDVGTTSLSLNGSGAQALATGTIKASGTGRLVLDATPQFTVADGRTLTISAPIIDGATNTVRVSTDGITGSGIVALTGANTYTGPTAIIAGTLAANRINSIVTDSLTGAVRTASSSLGAPGNLTDGTINLGSASGLLPMPILRYTGTGETTDRPLNLVGAGVKAGRVDMEGTGTLKFLADVAGEAAGPKFFTLGGNSSGVGEIAGVIDDGLAGASSQLSLVKAGTGTWRLSGANKYDGITQINSGKLVAVASGAVSNVLPAHNSDNAVTGDTIAAMHMRGGTFQYIGAGGTQILESVAFITGANVIDATDPGGGATIDLSGGNPGAGPNLARTPVGGTLPADGTVDFQTSTPGSTVDIAGANTRGNVTILVGNNAAAVTENGALGAWATVNKGAALATVQTNAANPNTLGAITPYLNYFDVIANGGIGNAQGRVGVAQTLTNYSNNTLHFRFGTNYTTLPGSNPGIAAGVMGLRTLTQNSTQQDVTVNMSANQLKLGIVVSGTQPAVGGVFVTPQAKSLTLGQVPGEGVGITAPFNNGNTMPFDELILGNFSVASAQTPTPSQLTINANINNAINNNFLQIPVRVIISGPGIVNLNGPSNAFSGGVYLLNGTLNLNDSSALGMSTGPTVSGAGVNLGLLINGGNLGNTSGGAIRIPDGRFQNWGADFSYSSNYPLIFGGGAGGNVTMTDALLANVGFTRKVTVTNAPLSIGGTIGGSAALVKDGAGELDLYANSASFFDGGLIVWQGTVAALANGTTFGTNAITLGDTSGSGNATLAGGPISTGHANDIVVAAGSSGTRTIRNSLDYATKFTGTITAGGSLTIGAAGSGSVNIAGMLAGAGGVTVAAGNDRQNIVDFSTANGTFRGNVAVASGTLRIGAGSSLGDTAGSTSVLAGGTLDLNGQTVSESLGLLGFGAKGAGALVNNSGTAAVSNGSIQLTGDSSIGGAGNLTQNGVIGGVNGGSTGFGLTKVGTGATTLTAANNYTGVTFVRGGSLILDTAVNATVLDPRSPMAMGGGTLQLKGVAGASRTQVLTGLNVGEGANSVVVNNNGGTDTTFDFRGTFMSALGFSRGNGTVDFRSANPADFGTTAKILTTQLNLDAGAIGAWATVNGGAALATNNNGVVMAFTGYSEINGQGPTSIVDNSQAHVRVNNGANATLPLAAATTNIFTLTQNATTGTTIDTSAGTLRLGGDAGVYITPGSGALTLGTTANAGIVTAGGAANTAGSIIFNNSSAAALTVNSAIANNGTGEVSLVKTGMGTLSLNGTNSFTGPTILQQGQLNLGQASALGSGGYLNIYGGTIDNTSGAPMTMAGLGQIWSGDFTFAGTQALTFDSPNRFVLLSDAAGVGTRTITIPNAALTLNEGIEGGMALVKTGAGTLNLSGASSGFSGGLTIASGTVAALDGKATFGTGTLQIGDSVNNTDSATLIAGLRAGGYDNKIVTSNHTNGAFTGTLTVKSVAGSTLKLNGGIHLNDDLTMTTQGTGGMVLNGAITGNGNLFLNAGSAPGNVIQLNGDNTYYLGKIEIDAGTVKLGNDGALGTNYLGTTLLNGAALDLNGVSISDSVIAAGTGINGKGALLNNSATAVTVNGGFQIQGTSVIVVGGLQRTVGETSVGGSGNITFTTSISSGSGVGQGAFLTLGKVGTGTVTLASGTASSYIGQTLVHRGTLIEDLTNLTNNGTQTGTLTISQISQLALDGGTFQLTGMASQATNTTKTQTFLGTGSPQVGAFGTVLTGGSSNIVLDNPASAAIPPILALSLSQIGRFGGTLNFSMLRGNTSLFANGAPVSGSGAATNQFIFSNSLDNGILGAWATVTSPTNGIVFASKDANGRLTEYTGYTDIALGGSIADDGTKNVRINSGASGNVTLAGATTTNVNTLTQRLIGTTATVDTTGKTLRFGVTGGIVVANSATQQGGGLTIGTAPGSGTVTAGGTTANAAGELIISNFSSTGAVTMNANIVDNGGGSVKVTKGAAGTVTLAGTNNTYSGGTFVEAGTLLVTGSISGSTTVHTDATLGGTGMIGGPVTLNLDANLAPGLTGAAGTLKTGNLSLADSAQFKFDLGGKLAGQFDSVTVTGTVTLGTLNAGPSLVASFINGFNAVPGDSFTLISNDFSDPIVGTFATGSTYAVGNYVFDVNYAGGDGNDLVLTVAVPEPGSAALLLGAAAPMLGLRRFRRRGPSAA